MTLSEWWQGQEYGEDLITCVTQLDIMQCWVVKEGLPALRWCLKSDIAVFGSTASNGIQWCGRPRHRWIISSTHFFSSFGKASWWCPEQPTYPRLWHPQLYIQDPHFRAHILLGYMAMAIQQCRRQEDPKGAICMLLMLVWNPKASIGDQCSSALGSWTARIPSLFSIRCALYIAFACTSAARHTHACTSSDQ
jgi:hypothetical protein